MSKRKARHWLEFGEDMWHTGDVRRGWFLVVHRMSAAALEALRATGVAMPFSNSCATVFDWTVMAPDEEYKVADGYAVTLAEAKRAAEARHVERCGRSEP